MQKYILTTTGIALIPLTIAISSVQKAATQEYPGCFLITTTGTVVELNKLCTKDAEQTEPLEFSGLEFKPPIAGLKPGEIQGAVTNKSNKVILLKTIYFQLIANKQVIGASNVSVETGNGLQPGESLSFNTAISSRKLGRLPVEGVSVEVTRYE